VRLQKNINVINQDGGSRCDNDDETKEGIPVYLDPANQTAIFNKRLPVDNGLIATLSPLPEAIANPPASGLSLC
jgi:hypothetical protein